jgi:glycosyltransferase involved in cell wall biosynthesis
MSKLDHIALVVDAIKAGGAERVITAMARYWSEREVQVSLITFKNEACFYPMEENVQLISLDIAHKSAHAVQGMFNTRHRVRVLRARLKELKPDVVISFFADISTITILAVRKLGIPVIVSERNHPRQHVIPYRWKLARQLFYRRAENLVVQSAEMIPFYQRLGVDTTVIGNPLREVNIDSHQRHPWILGVGRLTHQKGFDLLVRAYASSGLYPRWQLVIVGEGEERDNLLQLARKLGVDEGLQLPGLVRDVDAYYARASLFVLSSRYEGFPNALAEAMGAGLACISFNCEYGPEKLLGHKGNGMLVATGNVEEMGRSLAYLAASPDERERMGREARGYVSYVLSNERVMKRWDDLIEQVINGSARRNGSGKHPV